MLRTPLAKGYINNVKKTTFFLTLLISFVLYYMKEIKEIEFGMFELIMANLP